MHEKWSEGKYIAYFQAFTNTHAPVEVLKEKYEPTSIGSALLPAKSPLPAAEQNVHPPCATVPSRLGLFSRR
jgi:hypothetical protein